MIADIKPSPTKLWSDIRDLISVALGRVEQSNRYWRRGECL